MAIAYPLTAPERPGFRNFSWEGESAVVVQKREFTFQQKAYGWDGQIRRANCELGPLINRDIIAEWDAFIMSLNGQQGTFYLQDPYQFRSRGNIKNYPGASGSVQGADQIGESIVTDGWPTGVANLFKKSDWISIGGRLYQLRGDVNSDGGGVATLPIWPFARKDLANDATILTGENAKGIFRMLHFPRLEWNVEEQRDGISFSCEEAF